MILNNYNLQIIDFEDYNKKYCNVGVAILGAAGIGAASQAYSASKAAEAQRESAAMAAGTAKDAQNINLGMYERTRADLAPFRDVGIRAGSELEARMPFLTSPIVGPRPVDLKPLDQAALEATPGYQFTRHQGLKATQNAAAARGLGVSGAALKGAANFATGLADNTYQARWKEKLGSETTRFQTEMDLANLENVNRSNTFNRLKSIVDTGHSAAAQTGASGSQAAQTNLIGSKIIGDTQIGAGNANAAAWNATGSAVSNFGNNAAGYMMYRGLYGTPAANNVVIPTGGGGPGGYDGGYA